MTFYNPFFPQFPRIPMPKSTNTTQNVNNSTNSCNTSRNTRPNDSTHPHDVNSSTHTSNANNSAARSSRTSVYGLYQNFFKSQVPLQNYLKETDTLIILGLLFLLYSQETKDFSLMLCLLLLLFDN